MKLIELRGKDIQSLESEIGSLLKSHFSLRMQKATQQITDHQQLKTARRDIARARTVLAEKIRYQDER